MAELLGMSRERGEAVAAVVLVDGDGPVRVGERKRSRGGERPRVREREVWGGARGVRGGVRRSGEEAGGGQGRARARQRAAPTGRRKMTRWGGGLGSLRCWATAGPTRWAA